MQCQELIIRIICFIFTHLLPVSEIKEKNYLLIRHELKFDYEEPNTERTRSSWPPSQSIHLS